jgi:hypothetical protein
MDWPTVVVSLIGSAIVGPASVGLSKFLGDRSIERQKAQQNRELSVGATSHMATVAFDKHIGFCEEYVEEMYKALHTLIQDGRTEEPLDARRFSRIRQKWALWLTHEIENKLDQFELQITQIVGGAAQDVDANGPVSNERSLTRNIAYLREVLRTEELTALRNELVIRSSRKPRHVV